MARLLISFSTALIATASFAQSFGRFGYGSDVSLPGFRIERQGFRADAPGSSPFSYVGPTTDWRCTEISDMSKTAFISLKGRAPRKINLSLLSPGFSLYFEAAMSLRIGAEACPFLTWVDGSVGPDVPTAPTSWVLISFQTPQPPILIVFPDHKFSVSISGSPGAWTLRTTEVSPCWARIEAPLGAEAAQTTSAKELGTLLQRISPNLDVWTAPPPVFKNMEVRSNDSSVTSTWHFDRPFALIPSAALLSSMGGYQLKLLTPARDLGVATADGPLEVCTTNDLSLEFPVRKLAKGRCLVSGSVSQPNKLANTKDIVGMLDIAFDNMESVCDPKTRELATSLSSAFINQAQYTREPITGQQLPYDVDGRGCDLCAACAFAQASALDTAGQDVEANPLLLSVLLRRDWYTWKVFAAQAEVARTAGAILSIACSLGGDERFRLDAGMLQAGVAAEKGLEAWGAARAHRAPTALSDPFVSLRGWLFDLTPNKEHDPFVNAISSPIHIYADCPISGQTIRDGVALSWLSQDAVPKEIVVGWNDPFVVEKGRNVLTVAEQSRRDEKVIRVLPADIGMTELKLAVRTPPPIPDSSPPPRL